MHLVGRSCLFRREHHIRIASVLQSLNAELLDQSGCLFGGGTAIVLARGEYRESVDIDFIVSDKSGYQKLRSLLVGSGINSIVREGMSLTAGREIRADQYGIRTMLKVGGIEIKFEIILEGRIDLELPTDSDRICGVSTLTAKDMATTKLLANSDRWSDNAVNSRDLIDLAMIGLSRRELHKAIEKAEGAYGESIKIDLEKAIAALANNKGKLEKCMTALQIGTIPKAVLWKHIRDLKQ